MAVLDLMTREIVTVHRTDSLARACEIMETANVRHLVVVDADGGLVGVVSDRDCKLATQSPFLVYDDQKARGLMAKITVDNIMAPAPHWIDPQSSASEAAQIMLEHRISALPVLHDGSLIGIVTSTDLLKLIVSVTENE